MNEKYSEDLGEQVISMLKELNLILEKLKQERKNAKECPSASGCRDRFS